MSWKYSDNAAWEYVVGTERSLKAINVVVWIIPFEINNALKNVEGGANTCYK